MKSQPIQSRSKAEEFEARIERLKREGKMPTFYNFLGAMKRGSITPPEGATDARQ